MDDLQLLAAYARDGDAGSFRTLVMRHQGMVLATCRRVLGRAAEAEDATQETFIRLAARAGSIQTHVAAWLHTTAHNLALNAKASQHARNRRERAWQEDLQRQATDHEACLGDEVHAAVDACLAELDAADRDLLVRHYLAGQSQSRLAADLGVSQPMISRRIEQALEKLRRRLRNRDRTASAVVLLAACHPIADVDTVLTGRCCEAALAGVGYVPSSPWMPWAVAVAVPVTLALAASAWFWLRTTPASPAPTDRHRSTPTPVETPLTEVMIEAWRGNHPTDPSFLLGPVPDGLERQPDGTLILDATAGPLALVLPHAGSGRVQARWRQRLLTPPSGCMTLALGCAPVPTGCDTEVVTSGTLPPVSSAWLTVTYGRCVDGDGTTVTVTVEGQTQIRRYPWPDPEPVLLYASGLACAIDHIEIQLGNQP